MFVQPSFAPVPSSLVSARNMSEFLALLPSFKEDSVDPREINRLKCLFTLKEKVREVVAPFVQGKNAVLLDQVFHWNIGDSFIQVQTPC